MPDGFLRDLATGTIDVAQETLVRPVLLRYVLLAAGVVIAIAVLAPVFERGSRQDVDAEAADTDDAGAEPPSAPEPSGRIDRVRRSVDERTPDRVTVKSSRT
jgi:hypothetical protein